MKELGIVGIIVLVLASVGMLAFLPSRDVIYVGFWLVVIGFGVGIPAGFFYHVQLKRTLGPRGELPKGWIWRPISLNKKLRTYDRFRVLSWCYIGGAGFFVIVLGLVAVVMGLVTGFALGPRI